MATFDWNVQRIIRHGLALATVGFLAGVGLLAGALAPIQAHAAACRAFQAAPTLSLQPFVLSTVEKLTLPTGDCSQTGGSFQITGADGEPVASVKVNAGSDRATFSFEFVRDVKGATFGVRAVAKAQEARLLNAVSTRLTADEKSSVSSYYPYNWTQEVNRSPRHGDSIVPGFKAGRLHVVYDTRTLVKMHFTARPGEVEALFPFHKSKNEAGDVGDARLHMRAGDQTDMRFFFHAGLAHIQDARFATPDRKGMEGAQISQFVPRFWTPDPSVVDRASLKADPTGRHCAANKPGNGLACFATTEEMQAFASGMPGDDGIVIARIALPTADSAAAIKAGGAIPYYYLFFGAVSSRDGDPSFKENGLVLMDSAGKPHMAPQSVKSKGNWFLLDLTQKAARDYFVGRALEALDAGYEGIFMDGGFLWNMPNGRVGGDNPDAAISQYEGRMLLMQELRAAMRARKPASRLAILANAYAEYMHYADWVLREGTSLHWRAVGKPPHLREMVYDPKLVTVKSFQQRYGRLIENPLIFSCKGPNAVILRTCRENLGVPHAGIYYDSGDWRIYNSELAALLLQNAFAPGDLYVTRTAGDAKLASIGMSRLMLHEGSGRVWFSRKVPLLDVAAMTPIKEVRHLYNFGKGDQYAPADREGPNGWTWTPHGFAYLNDQTFLAGDFYIVEPPTSPAPGKIQFVLAPEPRLALANDTAGPALKATVMSIQVALSGSGKWQLERLDGAEASAPSSRKEGGRDILEINGVGRVALTLTVPTP